MSPNEGKDCASSTVGQKEFSLTQLLSSVNLFNRLDEDHANWALQMLISSRNTLADIAGKNVDDTRIPHSPVKLTGKINCHTAYILHEPSLKFPTTPKLGGLEASSSSFNMSLASLAFESYYF